ncbi:MAG: phospholipase D family protein [Nitrososphaerota archaeon]|nr:phospholipase D family protein [Nitrososphaerota archaeon]MDG7036794.1 phospholipase D family protein [Nitrososphaerota archaeon]MDG7039139.1 phospholipase D family protein [Nitrososphaerota archaeon]
MIETQQMLSLLKELSLRPAASISELKKASSINEPILPALLWLSSMGFVTRKEISTRHPVIDAIWSITSAGRTYLAFSESNPINIAPVLSQFQVIYTIPPSIRSKIKDISVPTLYEALVDLFSSSLHEVLICSPYIDELILPLLEQARGDVIIKILTEDANSPLFKRLVMTKPNVEVRCIKETAKAVQLYQVHAKFICIDNKSSIIMSANLNERSLYYNIETGILIHNNSLTEELSRFFRQVYSVAKQFE